MGETATIVGLDQLPRLDEEIPCEATHYGAPCQNPASWLLIMGCGHRSGALCDPCRAEFIIYLGRCDWTHESWACTICGFNMTSPDDVQWIRL